MLFRPRVQRHMVLEPPRSRTRSWWRWLRYFFVLLVTVVIGALVFAARSASAADAQVAGRGELLLSGAGGEYQSAVQLHSKVHPWLS
jgi:hypothetical protein